MNTAKDVAQLIIDLAELQAEYLELLESKPATELRTAKNTLRARMTRAAAEDLAAQIYPGGKYRRKTRLMGAITKLLEANSREYDVLFAGLLQRTDDVRKRYPNIEIRTIPIEDVRLDEYQPTDLPLWMEHLPIN